MESLSNTWDVNVSVQKKSLLYQSHYKITSEKVFKSKKTPFPNWPAQILHLACGMMKNVWSMTQILLFQAN